MEADKGFITGNLTVKGILPTDSEQGLEYQMKEAELSFEREKLEKQLRMKCLELACKAEKDSFCIVQYARDLYEFVQGK